MVIHHDSNRTQQLKKAFLNIYPEAFTVTDACKRAGINRTTYYAWMDSDPQFVKDMETAKKSAVDLLEHEARSRAIKGSDTLLIFLLKGAAPDKYKDRLEQKVTADVSIKKEISELSDDELRDIAIRGRTGTVKAQSSAPALN